MRIQKHGRWIGVMLGLALAILAGACGDGATVSAPPFGSGTTSTPQSIASQGTGGQPPSTASSAGQGGRSGAVTNGVAGSKPTDPNSSGQGGGTAPVLPPSAGAGGDTAPGMSVGSAATDMQTIVPDKSWTCGMEAGIPPPELGKLIMEIEFTLGEVYDIGDTQFGHRVLTEIKGGTLKGMVAGKFLDRGLDWQLTLPTGSVELEQVNIFQADSGGTVYFRNCGVSPKGGEKVRIVPDFEAPSSGALAFLNSGKFAGYREFDAAKKTMKMTVYDIAGVTAPADKVAIVDPAEGELPNQTWECKKAQGTRGGVFYNESVAIGGPVMVGASKRGTRNIIPITGGTTMGKLPGTVLSGGADFQLLGSGFQLDARYTAKTDDGELIIIRNCGDASNLVPVFEAKKDGKYAFVNGKNYFSSTPSLTGCCVNITIYDGS